MTITHVPAHNGLMEATYYNDETNGLMLQIIKENKVAQISRTMIGQRVNDQKAILNSLSRQDNSKDRLIATPETVGPAVELIDIPSSPVDPKCVPEKYKKLIPKGYTIVLVHQVQKFVRQNVFRTKDDPDRFTVYDPVSQRNYTIGDDVDEVFSHVFDGILPPIDGTECPYSFSKTRAKRGTCYNSEKQQITTRCGRVIQTPCSVCSGTNVGYDCTANGGTCIYTVVCDTINHETCLKHFRSSSTSCKPCCLVRNCGGQILSNGRKVMDTCAGLPEDEICPANDVGCLHKDIGYKGTSNFVKKQCFIDYQRCQSVFDESGNMRNSGVHCNDVNFDVPELKLCCRDQTRKHNLGPC